MLKQELQGDPCGRLNPFVDLVFGIAGQLVGRFCSYLLPFCPDEMAEQSQLEVLTNQMGHPVEDVYEIWDYQKQL